MSNDVNAPTSVAATDVAPTLEQDSATPVTGEAHPEPSENASPDTPATPEPEGGVQPTSEPADGVSGGDGQPKKKARRKKKKPAGPNAAQVLQRIGNTTEAALAYVAAPEPAWQKLSSGYLEELITDLPPITAAALLGPEALCRHFLASAATGRYRDLFHLWELFKAYPEQCKPILTSRTEAQERAKHKLRVATEFGLIGSAQRVADDIDRAQGLPWNWIREILSEVGSLIVQRPAVIAALLRKDPNWPLEALPEQPDTRWLSEAAALHSHQNPVPEVIEAVLGKHIESLPTTPATLALAAAHHPDQVALLLDRVNPEAEDVVATARWARDHGHDLSAKLFAHLDALASQDRAKAAALWAHWKHGGVAPEPLPDSLLAPNLDGLDVGAPESWDLAAILVARGIAIDAQAVIDQAASTNRQVGEKAYEAAVCAGFDQVKLPAGLASNPNIKADARCQKCGAWTWVRPKHEQRCPRPTPSLDDGLGLTATEEADPTPNSTPSA